MVLFVRHYLPMLPLRLLLLSKSLHPNLLVLAPKQTVEDSPLELNTLPHPQVLALIHHLLRSFDSNLAIARNRLGSIERAIKTLLRRLKHPSRKSPVIRIPSTEVLACEYEFHSPTLPNRSRQPLTPAGAGNDTKLDLRLAEVRFLGTVQHIRHHRQLTSPAQSMSIDSADYRLLDQGGEFGPGFYEIGAVGVCECFGRHFFDVGAGCEGFFGAGEDHGAD